LALVVAPMVFGIVFALLFYLAAHWPYPPGMEWVSRWTPRQIFLLAVGLLVVYLITCVLFFWRFSSRWLWSSAARTMDLIEGGTGEESAGAAGDLKYLVFRIERALENQRSAEERSGAMETVRAEAEALCGEIERMSARRFELDLQPGEGALAPLRGCLADFCTEMSSFLGGCVEVASQICETMRRAGERTSALASQAERAFVGQSELSVAARRFVKRVDDALGAASSERRGDLAFEKRTSGDVFKGFGRAVSDCAGALEGLSGYDETGKELVKESRDLADEATVIALNAAIEASRSESADLEKLAESARKLAERSMDLGEKVSALSTGYLEAVHKASAALDELRVKLLAWREEIGALDAERAESAASIEAFIRSVRDVAAELASQVEGVARMAESASSEGVSARKAIAEAVQEMESLKRRLGGDRE